jgi:hypothetical protein
MARTVARRRKGSGLSFMVRFSGVGCKSPVYPKTLASLTFAFLDALFARVL